MQLKDQIMMQLKDIFRTAVNYYAIEGPQFIYATVEEFIIQQMKTLCLIFTLLFWIFIYKLSFLEKDTLTSRRNLTIFRDSEGIPHIFAKNYDDIFYGLGYAQGQDRLYTLYFKKMLVEGRVSEIFGKDALLLDLQMRNTGFMEMAKNNRKVTDKKTLNYIQQYLNGLNQYAQGIKMLPFDFYLFWIDYEEWTIEDVLANNNLLSFSLEFDWFYEIARQRLLEVVGFDLGVKLITYGSSNLFRNTTIMKDDDLKKSGQFEQYDVKEQIEVLKKHWLANNITIGSINFPSLEFAVQGTGSNSWVIGGNHTVHGKPILASDPHLASLIPTIFYCYEAVLLDDNNEVANRKFGVAPDGLPTLSIGVSDDFAWGSTASYVDNKDVYYQTIRNNSGKMQYLYKDEWQDFRERKQVFKVRGGEDVEQIFYHTHRGVVIETIFMDLHWKYGYPLPQKYRDNHTVTLVPTHFRPDNTSLKGLTQMVTFDTVQTFMQAGNYINYPNIDSTYLFKNGSFGYVGIGAIPKRQIPQMGSFMKDGNTDIFDMGDLLTLQEKPKLQDPERGYLALCNNKFASDHHKFRSTLHEIVTGRAYRLEKIITQKIANNHKFTFEDNMKMQLDVRDEFASQAFPLVLAKLTQMREIWSNPETEFILEKMLKWDYVVSKESIEASYYHVWQFNFQHSLFKTVSLSQEEFHAIINHAFFENYQFKLLEQLGQNRLTDQQRVVCQSEDTKKYPKYHPCQVAVALAFRNLPGELRTVFGTSDHNQYKWGTIHYQDYKIIPYSDIPLLGKIWNRNYPQGGNSRTLNVAILTHQSKSYKSIATPDFRMITDLEKTYFSLQVGQSDRIFSPYYDNFVGKDRYIEYKKENPFKTGLPDGWIVSVDGNQER